MNEWDQPHQNQYDPGFPPGYPQDPRAAVRKKSKWLTGLLAFLIPGTGHLYLGLMAKGIGIMLLVALDICAIVFAATQHFGPLVIVLLSLLMPIIYFYNLFDALQSTDAVNHRPVHPGWNHTGYGMHREQAVGPDGTHRTLSLFGLVLLAAAAIVVLFLTKVGGTHWLFKSSGSMIGAIVLIGAGVVLWFWEMRGPQGRKD
ncbi:MAG: hypothetical protein JWR03_1576 [Cohnella sp.]|nr:hypothetical protein [Cohnella sp.]